MLQLTGDLMQHSTLQVRISRIGRTIELLHDRLHHLAPSQRAEALHVRTRLYVLTRCLKVLRAERDRRGMKKVRKQRTLPKRRLNAGHQQDVIAVRILSN